MGNTAAELAGVAAMAAVGFAGYVATLGLVDRRLLLEGWESARMVLARGGRGKQRPSRYQEEL